MIFLSLLSPRLDQRIVVVVIVVAVVLTTTTRLQVKTIHHRHGTVGLD